MDKATRTALSTIAAGQHGLLSVAQAREIGVANRQLVRAEARGQLRRVRRGVYAIGGVPPSPWEHVVGAALAAGRDAVISHGSAAAVHRFEYGATNAVELTVRRSCRSRPTGVVMHRSRDLSPEDLVTKGGVLVTSSCRTLVDLSGRLGPLLTERLLDEGLIARRWTVPQFHDCVARTRPNTPQRAYLERLVRSRGEDSHADSVLEAKAFRALAVLKPFEVHFGVVVGSNVYVLDAAWPALSVGAEVVGRSHRLASLTAFERERRKLNALSVEGWKIAHLTAGMSAAEMVMAVRALLAQAHGAQL